MFFPPYPWDGGFRKPSMSPNASCLGTLDVITMVEERFSQLGQYLLHPLCICYPGVSLDVEEYIWDNTRLLTLRLPDSPRHRTTGYWRLRWSWLMITVIRWMSGRHWSILFGRLVPPRSTVSLGQMFTRLPPSMRYCLNWCRC